MVCRDKEHVFCRNNQRMGSTILQNGAPRQRHTGLFKGNRGNSPEGSGKEISSVLCTVWDAYILLQLSKCRDCLPGLTWVGLERREAFVQVGTESKHFCSGNSLLSINVHHRFFFFWQLTSFKCHFHHCRLTLDQCAD